MTSGGWTTKSSKSRRRSRHGCRVIGGESRQQAVERVVTSGLTLATASSRLWGSTRSGWCSWTSSRSTTAGVRYLRRTQRRVVPSELTGCVRRARAELDGLRRGKDNVALSSGADDDGVSPPGQKLLDFYLTVASVLALLRLREFRLSYAVDFCRLDSVKGRVWRPIRLQRGWQRLLQRRSKVLSNSIWGEMQPNRQMGSGFVVKNHPFCNTWRAACGESVKERTAHSVTLRAFHRSWHPEQLWQDCFVDTRGDLRCTRGRCLRNGISVDIIVKSGQCSSCRSCTRRAMSGRIPLSTSGSVLSNT